MWLDKKKESWEKICALSKMMEVLFDNEEQNDPDSWSTMYVTEI